MTAPLVDPPCTDFETAVNDPAMAAQYLIQLHPLEIVGNVTKLPNGRHVFGREESCDTQLLDASVSRRHAAVERRAENFYLVDLGSTNGVFVNGTRTSEQELRTGDRIQIGNYTFKFVGHESDRTRAMAKCVS